MLGFEYDFDIYLKNLNKVRKINMELIQTLDFSVLNFIQNNLRNSFMDKIMPIITSLGNAAFIWIMIGIILLFIKKYRKYGYMIFISLLFCAIVGNLTLKPLVARLRPFDVKPLIDGLLIAKPTDYSFPSGHTMCSFAPAIVIVYMNKRAGILALILSILIGFSRLYLYVHYPSDVFVGMIIGILLGYVAIVVYANIKRQYGKRF